MLWQLLTSVIVSIAIDSGPERKVQTASIHSVEASQGGYECSQGLSIHVLPKVIVE
jgi:hypothetical protein